MSGGIRVEFRAGLPASRSPFRVVSAPGVEIEWVNRFLDVQRVRGIGELSLRQYAYWVVHFLRWWASAGVDVTRLQTGNFTESTLLDYIRAQRKEKPAPAVGTINARTTMLRRLYEFHFDVPMPHSPALIHRSYWRPSRARWRRPGFNPNLKVPPRVLEPLSLEQVQRFWSSFDTARDLAMVGLMLLNGLRSCEVLALETGDLLLSEAQLRVRGKGGKLRLLPLAPETIRLLDCYLRTERPLSSSARVFVSLKGKARGKPMTKAGLRSLFRHPRAETGIGAANPHRFRHTFGADMIRAGVSLPALQRLMEHSDIETTLLYVKISVHDIYDEYVRAVARVTGRARIAGS